MQAFNNGLFTFWVNLTEGLNSSPYSVSGRPTVRKSFSEEGMSILILTNPQ